MLLGGLIREDPEAQPDGEGHEGSVEPMPTLAIQV
jgi:hypothetical protein